MNYFDKILSIMIFLLVRENLIGYCLPNSPCPNVFSYMQQNQTWYGEIKVLIPNETAEMVNLEVKYFSRRSIQQQENTIKIKGTSNEILHNIRNKIPLNFIIEFPFPNDPPMIDQIILDGENICAGPFDDEAVEKITVHIKLHARSDFEKEQVIFESNTTPSFQPASRKEKSNDNNSRVFNPSDSANKCGTRSREPIHLIKIIGGEAEKYPWVVALFDNNGTFFCAANLISNSFVITAAHCTIERTDIIVKFGGEDFSTLSEPGTLNRSAEKIIKHPNYQGLSSNADIAIIKMTEPVQFNNDIKPVCLWPNSFLEESFINGKKATVIGWQIDEKVEAPKEINVIIKPNDECKNITLLSEIISDKTICATGVNSASGPCLGDSGGGLYMLVNQKWTLRGIISTAIGNEGNGTCDISVYTDTAKYYEWIKEIVDTE